MTYSSQPSPDSWLVNDIDCDADVDSSFSDGVEAVGDIDGPVDEAVSRASPFEQRSRARSSDPEHLSFATAVAAGSGSDDMDWIFSRPPHPQHPCAAEATAEAVYAEAYASEGSPLPCSSTIQATGADADPCDWLFSGELSDYSEPAERISHPSESAQLQLSSLCDTIIDPRLAVRLAVPVPSGPDHGSIVDNPYISSRQYRIHMRYDSSTDRFLQRLWPR